MSLADRDYLQINQAIFSLANAYRSRRDREGREALLGLTLPEQAVLMVLGQLAPIDSRQLSRAMGINPGTISVRVQSLVEKGLVTKDQDGEDRRRWRLQLTAEGARSHQKTVDGAIAYTREFLSALDETEQKAFHGLLVKASHSLGFDWQ